MSAKKTVTLENWTVTNIDGCARLFGRAYDHPNVIDGNRCSSSVLLSSPEDLVEGGKAETVNTIYSLGKRNDNAYKEWIEDHSLYFAITGIKPEDLIK